VTDVTAATGHSKGHRVCEIVCIARGTCWILLFYGYEKCVILLSLNHLRCCVYCSCEVPALFCYFILNCGYRASSCFVISKRQQFSLHKNKNSASFLQRSVCKDNKSTVWNMRVWTWNY